MRTGVNLVFKVLFILESFQHFQLRSGCSSATPQRLLQIELSLNRLLTHAGILLVMSVKKMHFKQQSNIATSIETLLFSITQSVWGTYYYHLQICIMQLPFVSLWQDANAQQKGFFFPFFWSTRLRTSNQQRRHTKAVQQCSIATRLQYLIAKHICNQNRNARFIIQK